MFTVFRLPESEDMDLKHDNLDPRKLVSSAARKLESAQDSGKQLDTILVRLVFAKVPGFSARSDFLSYRLRDAQCIDSAVSFLNALTRVKSVQPEQLASKKSLEDLVSLFDLAIGGIICHPLAEIDEIESLRS